MIIDYKDTKSFTAEKEGEIVLRIEFFIDDFTIVNPIGAARNRYNIIGIYFTLNNLPYTIQCKRKDINLVMLAKRKLVSDLRIPLRPIVHDLKRLNDGFTISNYPGKIRAILLAVI